MTAIPDRHLRFKSVANFRDIGGYRGKDGKNVVWRRVFRSGEFRRLTREELSRLTAELNVACVIDLRSGFELENNGRGLLPEAGLKYHHIEFMADAGDPEANAKRYADCTDMGEMYVDLARQPGYGRRIVQALEVIADPANHPLVYHCAVGKDRTGMLTAMLLSLLGVNETDIIEDYALSGPYMDELRAKLEQEAGPGDKPPQIPDYFWKARPVSMRTLLDMLQAEYGGPEAYLKAMGMSPELPRRLKDILLA